jgi:hypothetical protein
MDSVETRFLFQGPALFACNYSEIQEVINKRVVRKPASE